MKHNHFLLNLFIACMLLGGMTLSAAPALALETVSPGSNGQPLEGSYSWDNSSPDGNGWSGIFGGEDPAGGVATLSKPKPPKTKNNGWGGTFAGEDPAGETSALSKPKPPKTKNNGWGGTFDGEDPAGEAFALSKPKPPHKPRGNGWGGTFTGEDFSAFYPPVYYWMLKVY